MIYTGLSRLYVAKYSYDKLLNKTSYTDGISLGEAMDYVINITTASTPLYTNNRKRGEIVSFSDGSVTHKAPDSNMEASAYISGITPKEITIAEGKTVRKYGRSVEIQPPYLGFGTVYQVYDADANKYRYQPIITPKIQYQLSSNNVTTQGETITFNVPDLPAKVMAVGVRPVRYRGGGGRGAAAYPEGGAENRIRRYRGRNGLMKGGGERDFDRG